MTKTNKSYPSSKSNKKNPTPHDSLVKKALENLLTARELLEEYLPDHIKDMLDFSTIKAEKESFVEDSLKKRLSDVIFSIKTKNNDDAFVLSIIEHQSTPDYWITFRIMKYSLLLLERYQKNKKKLPVIIPVVLYNGKDKYDAPRDFWDLFDNPNLAKETMTKYRLIDLQSADSKEINYEHHISLLLHAMKHIHDKDILRMVNELMTLCRKAILLDKEQNYVHLIQILCYIDSKIRVEQREDLEKVITKNLPQEDEGKIMRTVADYYIEQGEARGLARGMKKKAILIAQNLLKAGISAEVIAKSTELSASEIQKIKSSRL